MQFSIFAEFYSHQHAISGTINNKVKLRSGVNQSNCWFLRKPSRFHRSQNSWSARVVESVGWDLHRTKMKPSTINRVCEYTTHWDTLFMWEVSHFLSVLVCKRSFQWILCSRVDSQLIVHNDVLCIGSRPVFYVFSNG